MRFSPKSRTTATTNEEKEVRLKAFITRHLTDMRAAGVLGGEITYRLLALSAESPAACAIRELAPVLADAGIKVEAVFARRTANASVEGLDCRFVTDVRLRDAHEQLVLDSATVWIGDCMRRDPMKRDAYELFSACPVAARNAARSFAQIWRAAGPSGSLAAERKWTGPRQPALFDPSLIAGGEAAPAAAILRH
jgi:hypothetical protein